jgi:hypothetical protein
VVGAETPTIYCAGCVIGTRGKATLNNAATVTRLGRRWVLQLVHLSSLAPAPAPSRRLSFCMADEQQYDHHNKVKAEKSRGVSRHQAERSDRDRGQPYQQHSPSLPSTRRTPPPTVALGWKPISIVIVHASTSQAFNVPAMVTNDDLRLRNLGGIGVSRRLMERIRAHYSRLDTLHEKADCRKPCNAGAHWKREPKDLPPGWILHYRDPCRSRP